MRIDTRRRTVVLSSAALFVCALPHCSQSEGAVDDDGNVAPIGPEVLTAWRHAGANYAGIVSGGIVQKAIKLPQRGHEIVEDPMSGAAVIVARRPGQVLVRADWNDRGSVEYRDAETNRSFNGHGAFSHDGKLFYTAENDQVTGDGVIGIRHPTTLEKIAELPSYGRGPHGILIERSGTLLVANGGLLDVPGKYESGKSVDMVSSLVRISRTGRLLRQWFLPDRYLSIRHLSRTPAGVVGTALQAAHPNPEDRLTAPVLAILSEDGLRVAQTPDAFSARGYAGDVAAVDIGGTSHFALGCAHASAIAWWNSDGRWVGYTPLERACALVGGPSYVVAATDSGLTAHIATDRTSTIVAEDRDIEWENHLTLRRHS